MKSFNFIYRQVLKIIKLFEMSSKRFNYSFIYLYNMSCGIYKIENIINNKVYIGKSTDTEARFVLHKKELNNGTHCNKHLLSSWRRYGASNFVFSILEYCEDIELNKKEILWIEKMQSFKKEFGYNKTLGGTGGRLNDESLEKMRKSLKGRKSSSETNQKISETNKRNKVNVGSKNGMFGLLLGIKVKIKIMTLY